MNIPDEIPTTRYSGSKRRLLPWIWENIKDLPFDSALDVFGGTGSVSILLKYHGKRVHFNDILRANQWIGMALVQNDSQTVSTEELEYVLDVRNRRNFPGLIESEFKDIFFTDDENRWLDIVVTRIGCISQVEKRALLMAALFQSCLSKRPYNLFHRANLYMRTADVKRSFGNKKTWETPFPVLMRRFVAEYNKVVFSNNHRNEVVGGHDAFSVPNGVDLVYLDPPYFSSDKSSGTNYLDYYHFLEGLSNYGQWKDRIDTSRKTKGFGDIPAIDDFVRGDKIYQSFEKMIERFKDNIVVLSYRSDGTPSEREIIEMFQENGKQVQVSRRHHRSALSKKSNDELLFVAN
ncbi:MAG: DNA adenine methylase [Chloroflexota bacterium]|nr:DNA adenine methylase [Chloroflexota bacterium]